MKNLVKIVLIIATLVGINTSCSAMKLLAEDEMLPENFFVQYPQQWLLEETDKMMERYKPLYQGQKISDEHFQASLQIFKQYICIRYKNPEDGRLISLKYMELLHSSERLKHFVTFNRLYQQLGSINVEEIASIKQMKRFLHRQKVPNHFYTKQFVLWLKECDFTNLALIAYAIKLLGTSWGLQNVPAVDHNACIKMWSDCIYIIFGDNEALHSKILDAIIKAEKTS